MENFDIKLALEWFGAILISLGGTSAIIIGLAKWFGDRLASILLEKDKHKYQQELETLKIEKQKELEALKTQYQQTLEAKKSELDKQKALFLRYREHQFTLYNDLWKSLCDLKQIAEELWEVAELPKLREFSKQLKVTKLIVEKSALLIEDGHYNDLTKILNQFGQFEIGKLKLISLRNKQAHELAEYGVTDHEIKRVIDQNGLIKIMFANMVIQLASVFKRQIRGEELGL